MAQSSKHRFFFTKNTDFQIVLKFQFILSNKNWGRDHPPTNIKYEVIININETQQVRISLNLLQLFSGYLVL